MRRNYLLFILIFLVFVGGCNEKTNEGVLINNKEVISVSLNVDPMWENGDNKSFKTKEFKDESSIKIFIEAIENVVQLEGILNYKSEFDVTVTYIDKTTERYHLNLGVETEDEGLLVILPDTNHGYIIKKEDANKLRGIIYK
ncbi:hypothetical protein [Bacillus alkalicellulosilyticus]|uniref:hypothetical protein n=1 Tax=Alkalihalobacterium alkalicellulosilyticum TaxID=1912214 RepID=UPI000998B3E1|nr:hypothetical protein [Bacillus alkalicellulosilyticus]